MSFSFQKKSQYSRQYTYQTVTGTDDPPNFDMGQTGYGKIDNNLFIFMNIGIPRVDGMDYKNHYDTRTESVRWSAKKNTFWSRIDAEDNKWDFRSLFICNIGTK